MDVHETMDIHTIDTPASVGLLGIGRAVIQHGLHP